MGNYYSYDFEEERVRKERERVRKSRARRKIQKARAVRIRICMMAAIVCVMFFGICAILYALDNKKKDVKNVADNQKPRENAIEISNEDKQPSDAETEPADTGVSASGIRDWRTTLVNKWNPIEETYSGKLVPLVGGQQIDERCYPELQQMMDDCRAAGYSPFITSSYRSQQKQEELFQEQVEMYMRQGLSEQDAKEEAGTVVAEPGTSEHQLGLAVDIISEENPNLDESQEKTGTQRWLMKNSWKYGFILRYPNGKSDITGIIYEPWHYRYVGKEAAKEIYEWDICLEEYLDEV